MAGLRHLIDHIQNSLRAQTSRKQSTDTHLLLHIGHPKTGTTALQNALAFNRKRLSEHSLLYPGPAKSHKHSIAIPYLLVEENHAIRRQTGLAGPELARYSAKYWQDIVRECRKRPPDQVVLSAEGFWTQLRDHHGTSLRRQLADICTSCTVVAYLRSPASRYLSQLNQRIRLFQDIPVLPPDYYRCGLSGYQTGDFESVSLNVFATARLINGDIVDDFCGKYLPATIAPLDRSDLKPANESVSAEAMALLQAMNTPTFGSGKMSRDRLRTKVVRVVREADQRIDGCRRPVLHPEVADAIVARSEDLIWLRDDNGISFDDVDYQRVGAPGTVDLSELRQIADFCPLDTERLATLRAKVAEELRAQMMIVA